MQQIPGSQNFQEQDENESVKQAKSQINSLDSGSVCNSPLQRKNSNSQEESKNQSFEQQEQGVQQSLPTQQTQQTQQSEQNNEDQQSVIEKNSNHENEQTEAERSSPSKQVQQKNRESVLSQVKLNKRISIMPNRFGRVKDSKVSQTSLQSISPESTPDQLASKRSKRVTMTQRQLEQEEQEKKDEEIRVRLIERLKTEFMLKQIHPFELFTIFDEPAIEFQIRQSDMEMGFKYLQIEMNEENYRILGKYYKTKDSYNTLKFCFFLVEDHSQLIFMAISHIILKYRILTEIFFDEISLQEKILSIESLKLLNKEWEWGFEERHLQVAHNLMTDYGNTTLNQQNFKTKLNLIPPPTESLFYQEIYQQVINLIIRDDSVMTFSLLLKDQDQASSGEVAQYIFIDILSMYIDRALTKFELMAIRVFLQEERDEEVVVYKRLLGDALKIIEEQQILKLQQTTKLKEFQLQIMSCYLNSVVNLAILHDQYFKNNQRVYRDLFIQTTLQVTNNKITKEYANIIFNLILASKLDQKDSQINISDFDQFLKKKKQEISTLDLEKQQIIKQPLTQEQYANMIELQSSLNRKVFNRQQAMIMSPKDVKQSNMLSPQLVEKNSLINEISFDFSQKFEEKQQISTQQLKMDIYEFFEDLDLGQLKFLTQQQMFFGLLKVGILFKGLSLQMQKSYDYLGFEKFILLQLKTQYNTAKLIYNLKREQDQYKESETDIVNMQQLKQFFEKLKLNVKFEDVIYIYQTLDKERSGFIKLSDFLHLIYQHPLIDYRLNELLFRIKGYYDNSLRQQRIFFSKMPFNYIRQFTAKANPPSYSFRIRPNVLGQYEVEPKGPAWNIFKVKILNAEGIPSPEDKKNCFRREVIVTIYDRFYKEFIENTVIIKAKYNPSNEDVWEFQSISNGFYLSCEKQQRDLHLSLIMELISYYTDGNVTQKVSCGFVEVPFSHIFWQGTIDLPLKGGQIEQEIEIKKADVRCNRSGVANIMAKIKGDIVPHITISSVKRSRRPSLLIELETMAPLCLCHRNMTQIIYAYKRFCRDIVEEESIVNIPALDMFLYALDCPYLRNKICKLWIRTIKGKMIGKEKSVFTILIGQLQKLMKMKSFNFNPYSPQEIFPPHLIKEKKAAIRSFIAYTEFLIDSQFENKLKLPGDDILKEQMERFGEIQEEGIFDNSLDPFDCYKNGLNLKAYDNYVEQIL